MKRGQENVAPTLRCSSATGGTPRDVASQVHPTRSLEMRRVRISSGKRVATNRARWNGSSSDKMNKRSNVGEKRQTRRDRTPSESQPQATSANSKGSPARVNLEQNNHSRATPSGRRRNAGRRAPPTVVPSSRDNSEPSNGSKTWWRNAGKRALPTVVPSSDLNNRTSRGDLNV